MNDSPTGFRLKVLALSAALAALTGGLLYLGAEPETRTADTPAGIPATSVPAVRPIVAPAEAAVEGELLLGNPVVTMNVEKGVLEAQLALTVRLPGQAAVAGTVSVSGEPRLQEGTTRFFLNNPAIGQQTLPGLPEADAARVNRALARAVADYFRERAVFAPQEAAELNLTPLRVKLARDA
ncbi:MAG TPA: hypothetical protein VFW42_03195 [Fluviicoccus sp.]|nr:hypothetical protein [Fluviicoccus sp.]